MVFRGKFEYDLFIMYAASTILKGEISWLMSIIDVVDNSLSNNPLAFAILEPLVP